VSAALQITAPRYTWGGFLEGVRTGFPIALSIAPWGLACGLATQSLVSLEQGLLMSAYVYSGTAQFVALEMWGESIPIVSLLIAVFAINARYLLQGLTLAPWLAGEPRWRRWGLLFLLSDAVWADSLRRFERGAVDLGYFLGASLAVYVGWVASSWLGLAAPLQGVDLHAWGLDFAITAALIGLAGARWSGRASLLPWAAAAASAVLAQRLLGGGWYMLIGGVLGAVLATAWDLRKGGEAAP
jgi:predicted branched-subunit amino acid permease